MGSKNKKSKKSKTPIKREEEADTSSPTSKNHVDEQQEEEGTLVGASDDIIKQEDASNQDRDDDKGRGSNEERDEENYDFDRPQEGEGAGNNANDEPKEVQGENSTKENHGDENEKKKSKLDKFLKKTENFNDKLRKRGVIYIARVPPKMTPTKVKSLLSEFGEITRVYLVEEDKAVRQRRRKQGGSGAKRYTEGWVEFAKKKVAKHVALSLNNTPISNFKRSTHYGKKCWL